MSNQGIYLIKNSEGDRVYVGASKNAPARIREHQRRLMCGNHPVSELQEDWHNLGPSAFTFGMVEEVEGSALDVEQRENHWIDKLNAIEDGYNSCRSGYMSHHSSEGAPRPTRRAEDRSGLTLSERVSLNLKRQRKRSGMTQRNLGKAADVHWSTVAKIEQQVVGVTVELLWKLAQPLGCGLHDLMPNDP